MMIEMGGEYWYEGAIFLTDALWSDVNQPQYTSPWEPVAAFNVAGQTGLLPISRLTPLRRE